MSIDANKIIFKRLIREYEFLLEDLNDIETANSEIKDKFMKSLSDIDNDGVLDSTKIENAAASWSDQQKQEVDLEKESNKHPDFKKLFRKAIVKCHPDKLSSDIDQNDFDKYKKIYEDLIESNETEDWAGLIRCSIKLELDLPESAYKQIKSIEKSIEKLKNKQTNILNSTPWTWYKVQDDDLKRDILKHHLDFMSIITQKK